MKIFFGADIAPTESNIKLFNENKIDELIGKKTRKKIESCDYRVFNLETPICDSISPIFKCGPNHWTPVSAINGLKGLKCDLLTLANNHILDQGTLGLEETTDLLTQNNISWIGVKSKDLIHNVHIFEKNGVKVGIYGCAEHEFSIYKKNTSGAIPYDPLESFDVVESLKMNCDYVVVLFHGGKEYYRFPSPNCQKIARHFIYKGANIILFQHSHCVGCMEKYRKGYIVYGQGNFLFDSNDGDFSRTSIGVIADFTTNTINIEIVPFVNNMGVSRMASGEDYFTITSEFNSRSKLILDSDFVDSNYSQFSFTKAGEYLVAYSGNNFILRLLRKVFGDELIIHLYNKKNLLRMKNFIDCESHSELFKSILSTILEEEK